MLLGLWVVEEPIVNAIAERTPPSVVVELCDRRRWEGRAGVGGCGRAGGTAVSGWEGHSHLSEATPLSLWLSLAVTLAA